MAAEDRVKTKLTHAWESFKNTLRTTSDLLETIERNKSKNVRFKKSKSFLANNNSQIQIHSIAHL